MKETERIAELFKNLFDGKPWLGETLMDTLQPLTAEEACKKLFPNFNSIWKIVNHIIEWRLNVLQRVQGAVIATPDHNYFLPIEDSSEVAWLQTLRKLAASQQEWLSFLQIMPEQNLANIYPNNQQTFYEHIHGLLQHDAYHLGQIRLLVKMEKMMDTK